MKAEAVGGQLGLVQDMDRECPWPVEPVFRSNDKVFRAAPLQPFVQSGRFHLPGERDAAGILRPAPRVKALYDEMTTFPAGGHDDTVDAAMDMMEMATGAQTIPWDPKPLNTLRQVANPMRMYQ